MLITILQNKEARKTQRESVLAKKDIGKVRQDIARLEHLGKVKGKKKEERERELVD